MSPHSMQEEVVLNRCLYWGRFATPLFAQSMYWLALLILSTTYACAHGTDKHEGEVRGIEISALAHGDMQIISAHESDIVSLAERQVKPDQRMQRLLNFTKIQRTYCFWGIVPGAIGDEESIFNKCSHAYLASAMTLLATLQASPESAQQADEIFQSISDDRAKAPLPVLCKHSVDTFHTGSVVTPNWRDIGNDRPNLLIAVFVLFACAAIAFLVARVLPPKVLP